MKNKIRYFSLSVFCTLLMYHSCVLAAYARRNDVLLVNKTHKLDKSYRPDDLITPAVITAELPTAENQMLRREAADHLTDMFEAADTYLGSPLVLSSAYRSYSEQADIYNSSRHFRISSAEIIAAPGTSEHQTGLAVDIVTADHICPAQQCFAMTRAAEWLRNHSYEYGFILRYPLLSSGITGYVYEPWHYRYVGVGIATHIRSSHQTLEQYIAGDVASLTP